MHSNSGGSARGPTSVCATAKPPKSARRNVIEYPLPGDIGVDDVDQVQVLVAPDGSLLVQTGCCRGWHSPDGQQWAEVLIDDAEGRVGDPVVEVDGVLLLAGQFGEGNSIYRSVDGLEWVRVIEADFDSSEVFEPWDGGVLTLAARGDSRDEIALLHLTEGATELLSLPIGPLGVSDDPDDPFFVPPIGAITGDLGIAVVNWQGSTCIPRAGVSGAPRVCRTIGGPRKPRSSRGPWAPSARIRY